jgi:predicted Zn-dependent protease
MKRLPLAASALLLGLLGACETVQTTAPGAVDVERKQQMLVSEEMVEKSAQQAYAAELGKAKEAKALNTNSALVQRVQEISRRLIAQTGTFRPDALKWDWQVNVQSKDDLNAYCMPGGKIMVYTGLIQKLDLTDDELATVIGHEMAHALREHSREAVSRAYAQQIGLETLGTLAGLGGSSMQVAGLLTDVTFNLPRSRVQESEADRIGLELMARAGYDPRSSLTLWKKMAKASSGSAPPAFLSTHPSSSTRQLDLAALLPKVLPLYNAAKH